MNEDRIGPDEAERILRDAAGGPRAGQDPLTAFLAAAAGPPADHELAGEEAAVAAFREARQGRQAEPAREHGQGRRPAPTPAPARRRRPIVARVLTVKTAVALGLAATAAGGVALAAGTGALPGPIGGERPASHQASPRPAAPHRLTTPPSAPLPGGPGGGGSTADTGTPAPAASSPAGSVPSPSPALPSPTPPGNGNGKGNGNGNGAGNDGEKDKKDKKGKKPEKSHPPHPALPAGEDASR
jgi:hypothetical protein